MALHGTSGVLVISLLGVAITIFSSVHFSSATELQAHTAAGVKTQQQLDDDAVDDGRIVGGKPTSAEDFPWQLYVRIDEEDGIYSCGGSIISQTWSMSAAHCFASSKPDGDEGFIVTAKKISLYAGVTDKDERNSDPDVQSNCFYEDDFENHVFIHPEYKLGGKFNNDIAIFKLKDPWTLTEKVSPIALANADDFIVGKELIVSGWGKTCADCGSSSILLYVTGLDLISRNECTAYWGSSLITDNMICHKTENANTCGGDSGGPVITGSGNSNGPPYVQIGIVSFGSSDCGAYVPKVFADVAKYRSWIDETKSGSNYDTCEDSSSKCGKWAAKGKCNKGKVFVKCKSSCACGINSNPPCDDTKSKCSNWAAKGKCSEAKVYKKCKSSCACVLRE